MKTRSRSEARPFPLVAAALAAALATGLCACSPAAPRSAARRAATAAPAAETRYPLAAAIAAFRARPRRLRLTGYRYRVGKVAVALDFSADRPVRYAGRRALREVDAMTVRRLDEPSRPADATRIATYLRPSDHRMLHVADAGLPFTTRLTYTEGYPKAARPGDSGQLYAAIVYAKTDRPRRRPLLRTALYWSLQADPAAAEATDLCYQATAARGARGEPRLVERLCYRIDARGRLSRPTLRLDGAVSPLTGTME